MRSDLPSGTVTFLFTDVEGSTRLLRELGAERYAEALAEHRRLIRVACAAEGGVEVDTQGDAFFFAFPTAPGALAAASEFTEALASGPIQVRVGAHTGTPLVTDEGYVGADVHRAARIAASGHGGQVVVSPTTAALLLPRDTVSQGAVLLDLGSHRLKDLDEPISLFQLGEGSFPPLKTIANTNLPTPASSFLGREEELYEADALLQHARLLTVSGPGGQGKTRFALELARRAREERFSDYPDGVFSCFLASLRDPSLVLATIAQTLNMKEQPDSSTLEALASHLRAKRMLLLLDNLEHLLEAAPELSRLLERSEGLTLLATSREVLRIGGETAYALPPLHEEEGIALFCARAGAEPSPEIAELCSRLEGLPLAIELAAARLAILTPTQLLERISGRLDLLKGGRDADPRQQTLRATIEWSYDLLSEEEQRLFRALSVFAGGCTLEAAEAVAGADLDTLHSLVDKSLLRFTEGRFWMLETIREYASGALGERGRTALRDSHLRFFADRLSALAVPARRRESEALETVRSEQPNVLEALAWASEAGAPEEAQKLLFGSFFHWMTSGLANEGDAWATDVVSIPCEATPEFGWALAIAGEFPRVRGDLRRALALKQRAIEVFERFDSDDARVAGFLAAVLADASDVATDVGEAARYAERALELRRRLGHPIGIAHALHACALVARRSGALDRAARLFAEAAALDEGRGDPVEAAESLCELAMVRRSLGDLDGARLAVDRAFAAAGGSEDRYAAAYARAALGLVVADQGDTEQAVDLLEHALSEMQEAGLVLPSHLHEEVTRTVEQARGDLARLNRSVG